jgi:GMP synthase-like glutamine amidotransferase
MRIHCLQHTTYDGPAFLPAWAAGRGHGLTSVLVPAGGRLPAPRDFDALIVMGGPMSLSQEASHPWIATERTLVERTMVAGKPVLGICLGAQLMAQVLGAPVAPGPHPEIGWFPVQMTREARKSWLDGALPDTFLSFFWHEETFGIPDGTVHVARSAAYDNQGFLFGPHLALQFHLEVTPQWAEKLVARDAEQLVDHPYIQSAADILSGAAERAGQNNALMAVLLDRWIAGAHRGDTGHG